MTAPLPAGPFDVVYADPPWRYDNRPGPQKGSAIELKYRTMAVEDIRAMPVESVCADDAVLFLWATNPLLRQALSVMDAWGFRYKTNAVWCKDRIGAGYWFRQQHELLLVGRRGGAKHPPPELRRSSVFNARRGRHSKKPATVAEWVEQAFPEARKVELFCRYERPGWTAWGDELRQCVMPLEGGR